ncbi:ChbG/HpnK family deacetylase [Legionella waltersii]|uniref:Cellobiose phosphorylase n=1 Tax=Legionella waltersii TaxID=66969 RepID=A0A0W1A015_9GAMM|nr:ChbG/HpnK family deacetylase [Legionella waltersii]KTD74706.1 cellobiose phosphorylase [Legionella waltersii]SNU99958.1 cellobiose phosphorylase [Legionella waltersii]
MTYPKNILLCADDFGLSEGVSQGIIQLVQLQRISVASCMANSPYFAEQSKYLSNLHDHAKFGLHFNLTEGAFLSASTSIGYSLQTLLFKAHARMLDVQFIAKELRAQFECYVDLVGKFPSFIDGHQHVHQFPQIREVLLQFYEEKLKGSGVYIRSTYPAVNLAKYSLKTKVLAFTGGKILQSKLKKGFIPHNQCFAGIYDFSEQANYRNLFRQWLAAAPDDTLIMCHPAQDSSGVVEHATTRKHEFDYFTSDDFLNDCAEFQIQLSTRPKSRNNEVVHSN